MLRSMFPSGFNRARRDLSRSLAGGHYQDRLSDRLDPNMLKCDKNE